VIVECVRRTTGEYWLAKAQSDGTLDVSANAGHSGMVGGVYLPRRTSQRRISNSLAMSDPAKHQPARHYRPFLKPPAELDRNVGARPQPPTTSVTQPSGVGDESDLNRRRESSQRKDAAAKQVLACLARTVLSI